MSERKLNPRSSRRYSDASTSRGGSTTSVVSPCASLTSMRPGMPLKFIPSPERSDGSNLSPRKMHSIFRGSSACDPAQLVRRRYAGHHLLVQADDPLHERLRTRRTTGHVDVDRDDLVHAL